MTASVRKRPIKKKAGVVDITASPVTCSNYPQVCEWLRRPLLGGCEIRGYPASRFHHGRGGRSSVRASRSACVCHALRWPRISSSASLR